MRTSLCCANAAPSLAVVVPNAFERLNACYAQCACNPTGLPGSRGSNLTNRQEIKQDRWQGLGVKGSGLNSNNGSDGATAWPTLPLVVGEEPDESGIWQNTIAAADYALEEASRIQRGVQSNLKLMQEVRALREELRKAHAEIDRYRGMHARVVVGMRQLEDDNAGQLSRLQTENEMLLVRHRVYKLLAEHYAMAALRFEPAVFAEHRDKVLHHILFQRRKGVPVSQIRAADIGFLLL